jgi:siderophore synthetase component
MTPEELRMYRTLQAKEPRYANAYLDQLPKARAVVLHRLLAALWREDIGEIRTASRRLATSRSTWLVRQFSPTIRLAFPIRVEHAFHNIKPADPVLGLRAAAAIAIQSPQDLVEFLAEYAPAPGWQSFAAELADTVANLTLAYTRSDEHRLNLRQLRPSWVCRTR